MSKPAIKANCANPLCARAGKIVLIRSRGLCETCSRSSGKLPAPIFAYPVRYKGRIWTEAEMRFLRDMREAGYTYVTIAARLNREVRTVRMKGFRLGLQKPDGKAHGRGGPSLETQLARIAFIQTHGRYPDKDGNPGRKLPKWWNTEGDGRKRELIPRPEESTSADDE